MKSMKVIIFLILLSSICAQAEEKAERMVQSKIVNVGCNMGNRVCFIELEKSFENKCEDDNKKRIKWDNASYKINLFTIAMINEKSVKFYLKDDCYRSSAAIYKFEIIN